MLNSFLDGATFGVGTILLIGIIFGAFLLVKKMAANDIIFTTVQEGQAKAILRFDQLDRMIMAYGDHGFKGGAGYDAWEVEPVRSAKIPLFGGIRIVGIPFIHSVHKQRFNWTSLEQIPIIGGGTKDELVTTEEKNMAHVLLQEDVYVSEIKGAETRDLVPVNLVILLTVQVINPARAKFKINHWLETLQNQFRPVVREFIGDKEFDALIRQGSNETEIERKFGITSGNVTTYTHIARNFLKEYGVLVKKIQVHEISQSDVKDVNLIELALKKYAATREAEKTAIDAGAEANRIQIVFEKIQSFGKLGQDIAALETLKVTQSNIFVGTQGGDVSRVLTVGDTTKV